MTPWLIFQGFCLCSFVRGWRKRCDWISAILALSWVQKMAHISDRALCRCLKFRSFISIHTWRNKEDQDRVAESSRFLSVSGEIASCRDFKLGVLQKWGRVTYLVKSMQSANGTKKFSYPHRIWTGGNKLSLLKLQIWTINWSSVHALVETWRYKAAWSPIVILNICWSTGLMSYNACHRIA